MENLKQEILTDNVAEGNVEFMLAEYTLLQELRRDVITLGESRANFFLAGVSGAIVGLALINQVPGIDYLIYIVNGLVFIGLLLWGLVVFARTVEVSISVIIYTRGLNRIRNYFCKQKPDLKNYLIMPINDDYPSFSTAGFRQIINNCNTPTTIALITSIVFAIGMVLLLGKILGLPLIWDIVGGVFVFVLHFSLQYIYFLKRSNEMERKTVIYFPKNDSHKNRVR
jgi:hypothetical protein